MIKVLIIQNIHNEGIKLLENNPKYSFEIIDSEEMVQKIDESLLIDRIKECDAISVRTEKLSSKVINSCKKLKIISRHGVGYDNVDLEATKKNNITLSITANANAIAVSEHVLFMMLYLAKGGTMYDQSVKSGNFGNRNKLPKTIELWKKKILIAGFGRIGQNLIKRCLGFEMKVYVYDPYIEKNKIEKLGGKKVGKLSEELSDIDFISIHMPYNNDTKNLFNYHLFRKMKKSCILINAARGGIINEVDLDRALNENLIFGAGLDVFEKEPVDKNNPLLSNKKVLLSPHSATFTNECKSRMSLETTKNIIDFFGNKIDKSMIVKL